MKSVFKNKIFRNIASLGFLQFTNYLVPIIVIPILLNRIGLEKYGIISLAQGIMNILVAITDYGLNLTGTRLISQSKNILEVQRKLVFKILSLFMHEVILHLSYLFIFTFLICNEIKHNLHTSTAHLQEHTYYYCKQTVLKL